MYNHFVCQLTDARLMDENKKYKKKNVLIPSNCSPYVTQQMFFSNNHHNTYYYRILHLRKRFYKNPAPLQNLQNRQRLGLYRSKDV